MFELLKKVGAKSSQVVRGAGKKITLAAVAVAGALVPASAHAAAADIVTYSSESGVTWNFSSVLTSMFTALSAAIGAGVLIWVAVKGYQLMKRFLRG